MRILGYIVTERKLSISYPFIAQVKSDGEIEQSLPVLYVGWKKIKENPLYKSILDKKLSENKFWTFQRSENRSDYESDVKAFAHNCVMNAMRHVKYKYLNVMVESISTLKWIVSVINESSDLPVYVSRDAMLYVPYKDCSIGISLEILEYCGVKKRKAYEWLRKRRKVVTDVDVRQELAFLQDDKYAVPHVVWSC